MILIISNYCGVRKVVCVPHHFFQRFEESKIRSMRFFSSINFYKKNVHLFHLSTFHTPFFTYSFQILLESFVCPKTTNATTCAFFICYNCVHGIKDSLHQKLKVNRSIKQNCLSYIYRCVTWFKQINFDRRTLLHAIF